MFLFEGHNTPAPNNMVQTFMKESKDKNTLNEYLETKLIKVHQGPQPLVTTLKALPFSVLLLSNWL